MLALNRRGRPATATPCRSEQNRTLVLIVAPRRKHSVIVLQQMTYAKKRRGFRKIIVGEHTLRWRFAAHDGYGTLTLQGMEAGCMQAVVTLPDAGDPWLAMPDGPSPKIRTVTPALARHCAVRCLAAGWEPTAKGTPFTMTVENNCLDGTA